MNREETKKLFEQIPSINWEILKYSNNHTKEEVILKYPEYREFINTIVQANQ